MQNLATENAGNGVFCVLMELRMNTFLLLMCDDFMWAVGEVFQLQLSFPADTNRHC